MEARRGTVLQAKSQRTRTKPGCLFVVSYHRLTTHIFLLLGHVAATVWLLGIMTPPKLAALDHYPYAERSEGAKNNSVGGYGERERE